MMPLVNVAYAPHALHRRLVADVAAQRVAGVGGVHDHAAITHDLSRAAYQSRLRVERVNGEELGHTGSSSKTFPDRINASGQVRQLPEIEMTLARPMKI